VAHEGPDDHFGQVSAAFGDAVIGMRVAPAVQLNESVGMGK
jgi:hypothetical protein